MGWNISKELWTVETCGSCFRLKLSRPFAGWELGFFWAGERMWNWVACSWLNSWSRQLSVFPVVSWFSSIAKAYFSPLTSLLLVAPSNKISEARKKLSQTWLPPKQNSSNSARNQKLNFEMKQFQRRSKSKLPIPPNGTLVLHRCGRFLMLLNRSGFDQPGLRGVGRGTKKCREFKLGPQGAISLLLDYW